MVYGITTCKDVHVLIPEHCEWLTYPKGDFKRMTKIKKVSDSMIQWKQTGI